MDYENYVALFGVRFVPCASPIGCTVPEGESRRSALERISRRAGSSEQGIVSRLHHRLNRAYDGWDGWRRACGVEVLEDRHRAGVARRYARIPRAVRRPQAALSAPGRDGPGGFDRCPGSRGRRLRAGGPTVDSSTARSERTARPLAVSSDVGSDRSSSARTWVRRACTATWMPSTPPAPAPSHAQHQEARQLVRELAQPRRDSRRHDQLNLGFAVVARVLAARRGSTRRSPRPARRAGTSRVHVRQHRIRVSATMQGARFRSPHATRICDARLPRRLNAAPSPRPAPVVQGLPTHRLSGAPERIVGRERVKTVLRKSR